MTEKMNNSDDMPSIIDGLTYRERELFRICFQMEEKVDINIFSNLKLDAFNKDESRPLNLTALIFRFLKTSIGNNIDLIELTDIFGKQTQATKYIENLYLRLTPITKIIFSDLDIPLTHYYSLPDYFIPIIPMILINGTKSQKLCLPSYNPKKVIENIFMMIQAMEPIIIRPWFRNFKGSIVHLSDHSCLTKGKLKILESNKLQIMELPVYTTREDYKEKVLEVMKYNNDTGLIKDYKDYSNNNTIKFIVTIKNEFSKLTRQDLYKILKLRSKLSFSSIPLLDEHNNNKKFDSPNHILKEFFYSRLDFYKKRKDYLVGKLKAEKEVLENQIEFISQIKNKEMILDNKTQTEIYHLLKEKNFQSNPLNKWKNLNDELKVNFNDDLNIISEYGYLLDLKLSNLFEDSKQILNKYNKKKIELEELKKNEPSDLWKEDLKNLLEKLDSTTDHYDDEINIIQSKRQKFYHL